MGQKLEIEHGFEDHGGHKWTRVGWAIQKILGQGPSRHNLSSSVTVTSYCPSLGLRLLTGKMRSLDPLVQVLQKFKVLERYFKYLFNKFLVPCRRAIEGGSWIYANIGVLYECH